MSNLKVKKTKLPYVRDPYLAFLINGARRTKKEGYPIIEGWMVSSKPPQNIVQWDKKNEALGQENVGVSFYCNDNNLSPVLNSPDSYIDKLKKYHCVIGMDASPYDNMPPVVQKSQIYCNLAVTYYFGLQGIKIIPNVRLGTDETYDSLEAYPKHHLIAIGTNGFTKLLRNRAIFKEQISLVVTALEPSGIVVYGPASDELFCCAKEREIPVFQYDSYMMKRNRCLRRKGVDEFEGIK